MDNTNIPHSAEAEQAVLGGLMLDNDRWDEVVLLLAPDDFLWAGTAPFTGQWLSWSVKVCRWI